MGENGGESMNAPRPIPRAERWRPRWDRVRFRFFAGADLFLAFLLVLVLNALAARVVHRFHLGQPSSAGLSSQTANLLQQIQEPLIITLFAGRNLKGYAEWDALLRDYEAVSPHIRVVRVDPERDVEVARALVRRHRLDHAEVITLEMGVRSAVVDLKTGAEEVCRIPWVDQGAALREWGERMISSGILGLAQPRAPVVAFAVGEGEGDPDRYGPLGYSRFAGELRRQAIRVIKIFLAEGVPEGVDLLIVLGPSRPYTEAARAALRRYWEGGGRILMLLDSEGAEGVSNLLEEKGIRVGLSSSLSPADTADKINTEASSGRAVFLSDHPVNRGIQNMICWMEDPIEIEPITRGEGEEKGDVRTVLFSVERHSSERMRSFGVAVERQQTRPDGSSCLFRFVVAGDSDMASNARWGGGNAEFLFAAVNWLLQREVMLEAPPRGRPTIRVLGNPPANRRLLGSLAGVTGLWFILAIWIRFARRG